jgi:Fic family protein
MKEDLGFEYRNNFNINLSKSSTSRVCFRFKSRFPAYIWNDSVSEGKAYTYPQVKTVLEGITQGGSRINDEQDILNQKKSLEKLIDMVNQGAFKLDKDSFCNLHEVAAKEEALSWGVFRTGKVGIAGTEHSPPLPDQLNKIFERGIVYIKNLTNPIEQALVFFMFGAYHQFFFDANKRTSRLIMNGILLSAGYDALVIPAKQKFRYNEVMLALYDTQNATAAIDFLLECYRFQDQVIKDDTREI